NCGSCGTKCATADQCVAGQCLAPCTGTNRCGAVCVDLQNDTKNCGNCGNGCQPGDSCVAGRCTPPCPGMQTRCNGTCVDTENDPQNCGSCGHACGTKQDCSGGMCVVSCTKSLVGQPLTDDWGYAWDGNRRPAASWSEANSTCAAIRGT